MIQAWEFDIEKFRSIVVILCKNSPAVKKGEAKNTDIGV